MAYLLALDQGTSSSRSIVFNASGAIVASSQQEFPQLFPRPGWVEHDPYDIWRSQLATCHEVLDKVGIAASDLTALGIANQRETTLVWDRSSGVPVYNAIVWQDRRSVAICHDLREQGLTEAIRNKTGLVLDAYFSGAKLRWLLDSVDGLRARAERGELLFGTVDTWLAWQLTGGRLHVTDVSNASRTMLWNIHERRWDEQLLDWLRIPAAMLPQVHPSSHLYGHTDAAILGAQVTIGGIAGDQQAALFGQACFTPGMAKNTYGTGCFMLMHTGEKCVRSEHGLISTVACSQSDVAGGTTPAPAVPQFAIEGSVFIGGAVVQWLRDGLKAIQRATDVEALAASVPDAGGVIFVPSFTGLGAPYWNPLAKGAIVGLSRGSTVAHIARAALESIAFQSAALLTAMERDAVSPITELRVDGGAAANNLLLQFQSDLLGIPVIRPAITETTALGAAYLAGLATGVFGSTDDLSALWRAEQTFLPAIGRSQALEQMAQWELAVRQVLPG